VAGSGAYIYTRKHLKKVPNQKKLAYASVIFKNNIEQFKTLFIF
jgi:hypothetical protein